LIIGTLDSGAHSSEYFPSIGRSIETSISPPLFPTRVGCDSFNRSVREFMSTISDAHSECLKINSGDKPLPGGKCSAASCEDLHIVMDLRRGETTGMVRNCRFAARENYKTSKLITFISLNTALGSIDYGRYKGATTVLDNAVKTSRVKGKCDKDRQDFDPDQCIGAVGDYIGHLNYFVQGEGVVTAIQDNSMNAITNHFREMLSILDELESDINKF